MNIKKSHLAIIEVYRKNIFLTETINGLSKTTKKDYPITYNAIKSLSKEDIIKINRIGNSKVCSINLNQKTISILSFLDEQEAISKDIPNINNVLEIKEFIDDILLIAGSYANNKKTKESDIDLVLITKENVPKKQKLLENLTALFSPSIHPIVISHKDFVIMLLDKKANFGREIFNNRILFRNAERYYGLIKEAIENGFRG